MRELVERGTPSQDLSRVQGSILRIECSRDRTGTTSVTYAVNVFTEDSGADAIFSTKVTFVCVDESGNKCAIES